MAVNKPAGDAARKGAVRKRSQLKTKAQGEEQWTKRSRASGRFMSRRARRSSRASGASARHERGRKGRQARA